MPAVYDKAGLSFEYPESWLLEEGGQPDDTEELDSPGGTAAAAAGDPDEPLSVTVHSPGGAFWTVMKYRGASDPRRYLEASVAAMREEYDNLDAEPAEESVRGHHLTGYDLNFFYLDLTNTTHIRGVKTLGSTLLIFCQADDREWDRIEGVFRAITASLLAGQERSREARLPR
jgi:hypothetical protein